MGSMTKNLSNHKHHLNQTILFTKKRKKIYFEKKLKLKVEKDTLKNNVGGMISCDY